MQQVAVKRLTAVTDPLLLNAIRKEISILQRVSFDRNVVQVPSLRRHGVLSSLHAAGRSLRRHSGLSMFAPVEMQSSDFNWPDRPGCPACSSMAHVCGTRRAPCSSWSCARCGATEHRHKQQLAALLQHGVMGSARTCQLLPRAADHHTCEHSVSLLQCRGALLASRGATCGTRCRRTRVLPGTAPGSTLPWTWRGASTSCTPAASSTGDAHSSCRTSDAATLPLCLDLQG